MKGRPSLFEVMNKAPEASGPVEQHSRGKWWQRNKAEQGPVQVIAEALTEEEAAEALAAEAEAMADAAREAQTREEARAAKKAERKAARAAMRQSILGSLRDRIPDLEGTAPVVHREDGRVLISMSNRGGVATVAALLAILLGVFFVGRYTAGGGDPAMVQAAAEANGGAKTGEMAAAGIDRYRTPENRSYRREPLPPTARDPRREAAPAGTGQPSVRANAGASIGTEPDTAAAADQNLNFLEIQWFDPRRHGGYPETIKHVREIQQFLADHGVKTFARRWGGGVVLRSPVGFPTSDDFSAEREAFRSKIAGYGRKYREAGGLYDWHDCLFVGSERAEAGQPL